MTSTKMRVRTTLGVAVAGRTVVGVPGGVPGRVVTVVAVEPGGQGAPEAVESLMAVAQPELTEPSMATALPELVESRLARPLPEHTESPVATQVPEATESLVARAPPLVPGPDVAIWAPAGLTSSPSTAASPARATPMVVLTRILVFMNPSFSCLIR